MIKQLKMINENENLIIINDEEKRLFLININNMVFESQKFYEAFFQGLSEKIQYSLINGIEEATAVDYKKSLRIFDNIKKIFEDIEADVNKLFDIKE